MNPETNKFEDLEESGIVDEFMKKQMEDMGMRSDLIRPDGSPVPKSWTVFSIDELVEIKGYTFKVAHIGESHILFEPVKPGDNLVK